jgi:hypothetical protein
MAMTKPIDRPSRGSGSSHLPVYGSGPVAANVKIFKGSGVVVHAGNLYPPDHADVDHTDRTVGVAYDTVDNTGGAAGDVTLTYERGVFAFDTGTGADEVTKTHLAADVYWLDGDTVALTNGTNTRPLAGQLESVEKGVLYICVGFRLY